MKKMLKKFLSIIIVVNGVLAAQAQHQEVPEQPGLWKGQQHQAPDTNSILYAFKNGQVHGHFRYYFMATANATGLTDYYANAAGGGIKYETAPYKGFRFGVSGFFVYNAGSSDLNAPDPKTNQVNRYETGLFDITDPSNKTDIDRLEELYLQYNLHHSHITFGKQLINTPFINLQDGRMRPTEVGGLWAMVNEIKNTKIETGFLYQISPRGTVKWYNAGESIGVYPTGVNADGTKAQYAGNINSKGIGLLGISHNISKNLSVKIWEVWVEQVFNTALLQADYNYPLQNKNKLLAGVQFIRQDAIRNGGNQDPAKTYFQKNAHAHTFGARIGWENKRWQTSLNYNRITADGRYLVPREWGRDPFFTFLPRERNEGLGDVHAYLVKAGYHFLKAGIKTGAGFGIYELPAVTNFALNKYGMPSYSQLNIDIRYAFKGWLQGLEWQLLYVYKSKTGDTYDNDKYVIHKVDMSSWNILFNFHF